MRCGCTALTHVHALCVVLRAATQITVSIVYPQDRLGKPLVPLRQLITLVRPLYMEDHSAGALDVLWRVYDHLCAYQPSRRALLSLLMAVLVPGSIAGLRDASAIGAGAAAVAAAAAGDEGSAKKRRRSKKPEQQQSEAAAENKQRRAAKSRGAKRHRKSADARGHGADPSGLMSPAGPVDIAELQVEGCVVARPLAPAHIRCTRAGALADAAVVQPRGHAFARVGLQAAS